MDEELNIESLTEEQADAAAKAMIRRILEELYTDGVDDLTYDLEGTDGDRLRVTGEFADRVMVANRPTAKRFSYTITQSGSNPPSVEYRMLSGPGLDEPDEDGTVEASEDALLAGVLSFSERDRPVVIPDYAPSPAYLDQLDANFSEAIAAIVDHSDPDDVSDDGADGDWDGSDDGGDPDDTEFWS